MPKKLIIVKEDSPHKPIDDGSHYYHISNSSPIRLNDIATFIFDSLELEDEKFKIVGSWNKKKPGSFHKDLDLICEDVDLVKSKLEEKNIEYNYYAGLSTITFIVKDQFFIPRKVDIFIVENLEFSEKAYMVDSYKDTDWPSFTRNCLLAAAAKVKFKCDETRATGRYITYKGLCLYGKDRKDLISSDWPTVECYLGLSEHPKSTETLLRLIKRWTDREKEDLLNILSSDKKFNNMLENNNKKLKQIEDEIY